MKLSQQHPVPGQDSTTGQGATGQVPSTNPFDMNGSPGGAMNGHMSPAEPRDLQTSDLRDAPPSALLDFGDEPQHTMCGGGGGAGNIHGLDLLNSSHGNDVSGVGMSGGCDVIGDGGVHEVPPGGPGSDFLMDLDTPRNIHEVSTASVTPQSPPQTASLHDMFDPLADPHTAAPGNMGDFGAPSVDDLVTATDQLVSLEPASGRIGLQHGDHGNQDFLASMGVYNAPPPEGAAQSNNSTNPFMDAHLPAPGAPPLDPLTTSMIVEPGESSSENSCLDSNHFDQNTSDAHQPQDLMSGSMHEDLMMSRGNTDPMTASIHEDLMPSHGNVDPMTASIHEDLMPSHGNVDLMTASIHEDLMPSHGHVDPMTASIHEDLMQSHRNTDPMTASMHEDLMQSHGNADPMTASIHEDFMQSHGSADPMTASIHEDLVTSQGNIDPMTASMDENMMSSSIQEDSTVSSIANSYPGFTPINTDDKLSVRMNDEHLIVEKEEEPAVMPTESLVANEAADMMLSHEPDTEAVLIETQVITTSNDTTEHSQEKTETSKPEGKKVAFSEANVQVKASSSPKKIKSKSDSKSSTTTSKVKAETRPASSPAAASKVKTTTRTTSSATSKGKPSPRTERRSKATTSTEKNSDKNGSARSKIPSPLKGKKGLFKA